MQVPIAFLRRLRDARVLGHAQHHHSGADMAFKSV